MLRNVFVVFALSGLWHGAGWNYLSWGVYHACLFVPLIVFGRKRKYDNVVACGRVLPTLKEGFQMVSVFLLALPGWIMFRSTGMKSMIGYFSAICDRSLLTIPNLVNRSFYIPLSISIVLMVAVEWAQRGSYATMPQLKNRFLRFSVYVLMMAVILLHSMQNMETNSNFIYMSF